MDAIVQLAYSYFFLLSLELYFYVYTNLDLIRLFKENCTWKLNIKETYSLFNKNFYKLLGAVKNTTGLLKPSKTFFTNNFFNNMTDDNTINTCHIQEKKPILCNTSAGIDLLQVLKVTCFVAISVSPCAHFGKFFVTCVPPTCAIQAFHPEFQCSPHCREKEVLEYQLIHIG